MVNWQDVTTWRVLVVDDEPDNREVLIETLEFRGAQVAWAANGADGLLKFREFKPDLVLADLSMPQMDGWQMHASIKADPDYHQEPIIALTAHAMHGDRERVMKAGFEGYLTKPIDIFTLIDDLRKIILKPKAAKEGEP